jgi:hypothetical protein
MVFLEDAQVLPCIALLRPLCPQKPLETITASLSQYGGNQVMNPKDYQARLSIVNF